MLDLHEEAAGFGPMLAQPSAPPTSPISFEYPSSYPANQALQPNATQPVVSLPPPRDVLGPQGPEQQQALPPQAAAQGHDWLSTDFLYMASPPIPDEECLPPSSTPSEQYFPRTHARDAFDGSLDESSGGQDTSQPQPMISTLQPSVAPATRDTSDGKLDPHTLSAAVGEASDQ